MSILSRISGLIKRWNTPLVIPVPPGWNPEAGGPPVHVPGAGKHLPPLPPKPDTTPRPGDLDDEGDGADIHYLPPP